MNSKILHSSLIISLGIMLGRASGLLREYVIASNLGISTAADMTIVLLTLPDFFISLFIGNAISAVLVPQIHSSETYSHKALFLKMSILFLIIFSSLAVLLSFFAPYIWSIFAPGLKLNDPQFAYSLLRISSIAIPFIAICSISRAFLQSTGKFSFIGLENFIYNISFILIFLLFYSNINLASVSLGIILAALCKYIPQLFVTIKNIKGPAAFSKINFFSFNKKTIYSYIEVLISYNILIMLPYIARAFSSFGTEGSIAIFNYAFKIAELPKALLISSITIAVFPHLSAALQKKKKDAKKIIHKSLFFSLIVGLLISFLALALLIFFSQSPFSIGNLTETAFSIICISAAIAVLSIPAEVFNYNIITLMHAAKSTRTPSYINVCTSIFMIPIIWALSKYEYYGVFIGLALTHWLMLPFYYWQLKKHMPSSI